MPISMIYTSCEGRLKVADTAAGKKIRCPKCQEVVKVGVGLLAKSLPKTTIYYDH